MPVADPRKKSLRLMCPICCCIVHPHLSHSLNFKYHQSDAGSEAGGSSGIGSHTQATICMPAQLMVFETLSIVRPRSENGPSFTKLSAETMSSCDQSAVILRFLTTRAAIGITSKGAGPVPTPLASSPALLPCKYHPLRLRSGVDSHGRVTVTRQ